MTMNKKMVNAINEQINAEMYSAYLYFSMASYFDAEGLPGFSNWMKVQAQEEMDHAMKFYNFVNERGERVLLQTIEKPETEFKSALEIFEMAYKHEQLVTSLINKLYELSTAEKDYASESFLKWFIDEQVEEEASAKEIADKIKLAGKEGPGLFMLDKELTARTYTPPATNE